MTQEDLFSIWSEEAKAALEAKKVWNRVGLVESGGRTKGDLICLAVSVDFVKRGLRQRGWVRAFHWLLTCKQNTQTAFNWRLNLFRRTLKIAKSTNSLVFFSLETGWICVKLLLCLHASFSFVCRNRLNDIAVILQIFAIMCVEKPGDLDQISFQLPIMKKMGDKVYSTSWRLDQRSRQKYL